MTRETEMARIEKSTHSGQTEQAVESETELGICCIFVGQGHWESRMGLATLLRVGLREARMPLYL